MKPDTVMPVILGTGGDWALSLEGPQFGWEFWVEFRVISGRVQP